MTLNPPDNIAQVEGHPGVSALLGIPSGSSRSYVVITSLILFVLAALPRLLNLNDFLTTDEVYHWIERVENFQHALSLGNWAATDQSGHPGVTLMWLGSLGIALLRLAQAQGWVGDVQSVDYLAWLRFPVALVQALIIPVGYVLLRRLVSARVALLSAFFWATTPYLIAHARLLHLDSSLTSFGTLCLLCLLIAARKPEGWKARKPESQGQSSRLSGPLALRPSGSPALWLSGVFLGLALLTKGPALIFLPIGGLALWACLAIQSPSRDWRGLLRVTVLSLRWYVLWLLAATLVVAACWPALWVNPIGTLYHYWSEIALNGGRPNGDGQFFLGQAVGDPGVWFYPYADLMRTTPLLLLGLILLPLALRRSTSQRALLWLLLGTVLAWTLVMTVGPKKFDRYVLPTWMLIGVLAAAGWDWLFGLVQQRSRLPRLTAIGLILGVLVGALQPIWEYHPYYLSYYNPLLGDGEQAEQSLLIGWGEGMEQVGAWLRSRPDAHAGVVLAPLTRTLQPFSPVPVIDVSDWERFPNANYAVAYIESLQRGANYERYLRIRQTVPLYTLQIHGITYATVHQLPKPYIQPVDALFSNTLHLRGISSRFDTGQVVITPSWDVRMQPSSNVWVVLALFDADGQKISQVDVAPGGTDYPPTSQWQAGQQLAVPLPLSLSPTAPTKEPYRLLMAVYDPATGIRLSLDRGELANEALLGSQALVLSDTMRLSR